MAIGSVVTRGFSNGTFTYDVALLPTRGYAIGDGGTTPFAGTACFHFEAIASSEFTTETITQPSFASESITKSAFANESIDRC